MLEIEKLLDIKENTSISALQTDALQTIEISVEVSSTSP